MSAEPLIRVEKLSKSFKGHQAVNNVSFELCAGQILALLGPNGSGKTTTIKMLLTLITPTSGQIVPFYHSDYLQNIGAVLEGARNSYWRLSVIENLRYFGGIRGMSWTLIKQRADYLLELLGLGSKRLTEVRKLSRGMQQKLAIANALIHEPQILLLDEPTLGLDVEAAQTLEKTIVTLAKESGTSILLTTHVMSLAERVSDEVFIIREGEQVAYAPTKELLRQFSDTKTAVLTVDRELSSNHTSTILMQFPMVSISAAELSWINPQQRGIVKLFELLDSLDIAVSSIKYEEPTLEGVFVSLTGVGAQNDSLDSL